MPPYCGAVRHPLYVREPALFAFSLLDALSLSQPVIKIAIYTKLLRVLELTQNYAILISTPVFINLTTLNLKINFRQSFVRNAMRNYLKGLNL